jgi:hypothetical protein
VSPKSRGRPQGRGRTKRPRPTRELGLPAQVLQSAQDILIATPLQAELWASGCLGVAWSRARTPEQDPVSDLCLEVAKRGLDRPTPEALAAVAALRRLLRRPELDAAFDRLATDQPEPEWAAAPPAEPVRAWRAVDVWDAQHALFVDYDGPDEHTLMAHLVTPGGLMVPTLSVLQPGSAQAWADAQPPDDVPMPLVEAPVPEVLAELAGALDATDRYWPRPEAGGFPEVRALAWSRCAAYPPHWPEPEPLTAGGRAGLVEEFLAGLDDPAAARRPAELIVEFGDDFIIAGPLAWAPDTVPLFLQDWLPRHAELADGEVDALPDVLKQWLGFALQRRGVEPAWIRPVQDVVDAYVS